jgi:hypothetical protein
MACRGPSTIDENDGDGPLRVFNGDRVTVSRGTAEVGKTYSAGSMPLCRRDGSTVSLVSIDPLKILGEVRLEGVRVRTTHWAPPDQPGDPNTNMVGIMEGAPSGLRTPAEYSVPTSCASAADPVGEIVVTLMKTGDAGGGLDGLRLTYDVDGQLHTFRVPFQFQLCGTDKRVDRCRS